MHIIKKKKAVFLSLLLSVSMVFGNFAPYIVYATNSTQTSSTITTQTDGNTDNNTNTNTETDAGTNNTGTSDDVDVNIDVQPTDDETSSDSKTDLSNNSSSGNTSSTSNTDTDTSDTTSTSNNSNNSDPNSVIQTTPSNSNSNDITNTIPNTTTNGTEGSDNSLDPVQQNTDTVSDPGDQGDAGTLEDPGDDSEEVVYGGKSAIEFVTNIEGSVADWDPYGQSVNEGDEVTITVEMSDGFIATDINASLDGTSIELEEDPLSSNTSLVYKLTVPQIPYENTSNIIISITAEFEGYVITTEEEYVEISDTSNLAVPGSSIELSINAQDGYLILEDNVEIWLCENGEETEKIDYIASPSVDLSEMDVTFLVPDKGNDSQYSVLIKAVGVKQYEITSIEYDYGDDVKDIELSYSPRILYEGATVTVTISDIQEEWSVVEIYDDAENLIQRFYNTDQDTESFSMPASNVSIVFYEQSSISDEPIQDVTVPDFTPDWGTSSSIEDEPEVKVSKSAAWTNIEEGLAQLNISEVDYGNVYQWPCDYIILVDCSATMRQTDQGQSTDRYNLAMNAVNTLISHIEQANQEFSGDDKSQVAFVTWSGAESEAKPISGFSNSQWVERSLMGGEDWDYWNGIYTYQPLTNDYDAVRSAVDSARNDAYRGSKPALALEKAYEMLNTRSDKNRLSKVIIITDKNCYYDSGSPGTEAASQKYLDALNNIDKCYVTQIYVGDTEEYENDKASIEASYVHPYTTANGQEISLLYHYVNNTNGFVTYLDSIRDISIGLYANNKVLKDVINTKYWDIVGINDYSVTNTSGGKEQAATSPTISGNTLTWNIGDGNNTVEKTYSVTVNLKLKDEYRYLLSDTSYPTNVDDGTDYGCKITYTISEGKYAGQTRTVSAESPSLKYGTIEINGSKVWTVEGAEGDSATIYLNRKMPSQSNSYQIDSQIVNEKGWNYSFTNAKRKADGEVPLIKYDNNGNLITYSITEQQPSFYTNLGQTSVTSGNSTTTNVYNEPYKVKVQLTKVDEETGSKLSGAVFSVYQWSQEEEGWVTYSATTSGTIGNNYESGKVNISDNAMTLVEESKGVYTSPTWLYYTTDNEGRFRIVETTAPDGYYGDFVDDNSENEKNSYDVSIQIDGSNNNSTVTISNDENNFTNQRVLGEISFNKYDSEALANISQGDADISGAKYKLYAAEDIIHQDQSGKTLYSQDEEIHLVNIGTDDNGYNIYNYQDKEESSEYIDIVTGTDGGVVIKELEIGSYYLVEQSAGEGYLVNPEKIYFEVSYEDETTAIVELDNENLTNSDGETSYVSDPVKKQKLSFYKITGQDTEDQMVPLEGAKFSIYLISDLADGKYADMTDEEVVQAMIDDYRDPSTLLYEKIKQEATATVYDEADSDDVTSGRLVKTVNYESGESVDVPDAENPNAYLVAELESNERGVVTTPSLPYGRYVVIETTTPEDKSATRPFVINITADDEDGTTDGDGNGTLLDDLVILMDHDVSGLIRIEKVDSQSHKTVLKEGVQYLIHDIEGAWFDYYTAEMTTSQKEAYKEQYGDLVVQYSQGTYYGTEEDPYTTKVIETAEDETRSTYIETPEVLPPGTYELEEINAPEGYVLSGYEGVISKDNRLDGNQTYYETAEDGEWTDTPSENTRFSITTADAVYDEEIGKYIVTVRQLNDPVVGKVSVYAEGEQLASAVQEGSTIISRLGDTIQNFFNTVMGLIGLDVPDEADLTEAELSEYKNYIFTYETHPIQGAEFTIKAAEDIYSQEGGINSELLFSEGDVVVTLVTDENGQAWTGQEDWDGTDIAKGLPLGKYTIEQTKAGYGFALTEENATPREIEIEYAGQEVPVIYKDSSYENPRQKVEVEVTKRDRETDTELSGAIFGLYAGEDIKNYAGQTAVKEGTLIAIAETVNGEDGVEAAVFDVDIPVGQYYVREIRAPYGYATNTNRLDIDASYQEDQKPVIEINETFTNVQTKVQINLMDYFTEEELDGAQLTLLDDEGNSFTTILSVHNGNTEIRGLEINTTYTLKELVSPEGYHYALYIRDDYTSPYLVEGESIELDKTYPGGNPSDSITFTVHDTELKQLVSVFNKPILGEMDLTKTGNVVTGYEETTDENGNVLLTPVYEVRGLPGAEYVIRAKEDIVYPDGYTGTVFEAGGLVLEEADVLEERTFGAFELEILKGELVDVSAYIGTKYDRDATNAEILAFYAANGANVERQIPSEEEIENDEFYYSGTPVNMVIRTDENGEASISGLPLGEYEVIEVKAPTGYSRSMAEAIQSLSVVVPEISGRPEDMVTIDVDFENALILPEDTDADFPEGEWDVIAYHPSISVIKNADADVYEIGDVVTYTITVINDGDTPLTDTHVEDSLFGGEIETIERLEIGESYTLTYEYTVPEGSAPGSIINNTVIVTGTPEIEDPGENDYGNPIQVDPSSYEDVTDVDTEKVSVAGADIIVQKTADELVYRPGETAVYTITVINPNAYELTDVEVTDNIGGTFVIDESADGVSVDNNGVVTIDTLPANGKMDLIYRYEIPEDAEAGEINNVVTVTGKIPEEVENPELTVIKQSDKHYYEPGETAIYTITVTNTGNVDLHDVVLTDSLNGTFIDDPNVGDLAVGESKSVQYEYIVPENSSNGETIINTATATGKTPPTDENPDGTPVEGEDNDDIVVTDPDEPAIHIEKTANKKVAMPGDEIVYTITVTNTGNVDLTNVVVTDELFNFGSDGNIGDLAVGETETIIYSYIVPEDAEIGDTILNVAIVTGEEDIPDGDPGEEPDDPKEVVSKDEEEVEITDEETPSISVTKTADKHYYEPGETVSYEIHVTNTGNVDLTNVVAEDVMLDGEWVTDPVIGDLAVGETKTLVFNYTIPMDYSYGDEIENVVVVTGNEEGDEPADVPSIKVEKTSDKKIVNPGDVVNYTLSVINNGNVNLTDVNIADSVIDLSNYNGEDLSVIGDLGVGEVKTITYSYTVPDDADNNSTILNNVVVTGKEDLPEGSTEIPEEVTDEDDREVIVVNDKNPAISITKSVDKTVAGPGEDVTFTLKVKNTGNTDLTDVVISDSEFDLGEDGNVGDLAIGEEVEITYTYTIPDDAEDGSVIANTAVVTGKEDIPENPDDPDQEEPEEVRDEDTEEVEITNEDKPAISVKKTADKAIYNIGDTVIYTITVKNTGNVDLTDVSVEDVMDVEGGEWVDDPVVGKLPVGEEVELEYRFVISSDISATELTNIVTATGTEDIPEGGDPETPEVVEDEDQETIEIVNALIPSIDINKTAEKYLYNIDETVIYTIEVTNDGNVDLTDVSVSDSLDGGNWIDSPEIGDLAVGESVTLRYEYQIPNTTVNGTEILNTVTATGSEKVPDGSDQTPEPVTSTDDEKVIVTTDTPVTGEDDEVIEIIETLPAHISINKTADRHIAESGDVITYSITVKNDGMADLENVVVADSLESGRWIDSPEIGSLAVGESVTLTYEYRVPNDVVDGQEINNVATVTGTVVGDPDHSVEDTDDEDVIIDEPTEIEGEDDETVIVRDPEITITKTADKDIFNSGELATYTITVTNTGNVNLYNVEVNEAILTEGTFVSSTKGTFDGTTASIGELLVGESVVLTFEYLVPETAESGSLLENMVFVTGDTPPIEDPDNPGVEIPGEPVGDTDEEETPIDTVTDGISIRKYGVDDGVKTPVAGAEYTLYAKEDIYNTFGELIYAAGTAIETAITGEDGVAFFSTDIPLGVYSIIETKAPDGYYSTNKEFVFDSTEWQYAEEMGVYSYHDDVENAITQLTIDVFDNKTLNKLSEVGMQIVDSEGNVVDAWITETEDGYVIKGLKTDEEYTIVETVPRDGYLSEIVDSYKVGENIELFEGEGNEISFIIHDVETGTTEDGSIDKTTIPEPGRIAIGNEFVVGEVRLNKDGETLDSWTLVDKAIAFVKSIFNFSNKPLEGVEFTIYAKEDIVHPDGVTGVVFHAGDVVATGVRSVEKSAIEKTNSLGVVEFKEMYLGNYTIEETATIEGFVLDVEPRDISFVYVDSLTSPVKAVDGDIDWTNERQKVHIEITKRDMENNEIVVPGAVFGLYNTNDILNSSNEVIVPANTLLELSETGTDGVAVFESDLPLGEYYVTEYKAPDGYTSSDERIDIDASYDAENETINISEDFFNEITKIYVEKYASDTNELLKGATLAIFHNDDLIEQWITDGTPHEVRGLIVGETYTLREIEPASGYAVAENITFVVEDRSEDGTYTGQTFTMTDEMTSVTFMKFDANDPDTGVGNATIAVYDKSGKEVTRATTDETGACTITKLPVGTYTWKEVAAPDGYALSPETYTFTINRDGSISGTTNFENDYVRIGIVKVDKKSKDKLEGAEFTLYDANGNEIETKTTDENGRVEFVKLTKGEYTIKETKAPSGYKKTDEEIKFTVTETYVNGNDYEVENTKKSPSKSHGGGSSSSSTVEPPASEPAPTGDNNQILGYLTLSALCLAFVAVIIKKRRNK